MRPKPKAGAWLAERHLLSDSLRTHSMLGWRCAALLLCFATNIIGTLRSTSNAPLILYATAGTFCWHYIPREIARWRMVSPSFILERLGRGSYALYLVHMLPVALTIQLAIPWPFELIVVMQALAIGSITFCFFALCERPSHKLARRICRRVSSRTLTRVAPSGGQLGFQPLPSGTNSDVGSIRISTDPSSRHGSVVS
jgi:peptidoglycan/LPS O-acetylase OafA/YrhL